MAHLSLKQRSPFRNSFIPSRRQSRQTDSVNRATEETLLDPSFLLCPSSRPGSMSRFTDDSGSRFSVLGFRGSAWLRFRAPGTAHRTPSLHSPPFAGTASVVGNRSRILNGLDVQPVGLERPDRRLAAGSRAGHADIDRPHAVLLRALGA